MAGYDDTYYKNHLQDLYSNGVYKVNQALFNLQNVKLDSYFKVIQNITYRSEDRAAVEARAAQVPDTFNFAEALAAETQGQPKLAGDAAKEYAAIVVNRSANNIVPNELLDAIKSVTDRYDQLYSNAQDVDAVTRSHDKMNEYMRSIIFAVVRNTFSKALGIMRLDSKLENTLEPWNEARFVLVYLTDSKINSLLEEISDLAHDVLCEIVTQKKIANAITDFSDPSYFKGPLYYTVRTEMFKRMKLNKRIISVANDNTVLYVKMLIADLYLKTCYPLFIYDHVKCMGSYYKKNGDFVNGRVALLAQVMFTYYFMQNIVTIYKNQHASLASQTYNNQISTIVSKLKTYLDTINNLDMTDKAILTDLHATSNQVVQKSWTLQSIKEDITRNQLAMRNVIFNTDELRKKYKRQVAEFTGLAVLLFVVIVACAVLIFLGKNLWAIYGALGVACFILLLEIVQMMMKFIKKS